MLKTIASAIGLRCRMQISKLRELESNQRPPGSEPGVAANSNYPAKTGSDQILSFHSHSRSSFSDCSVSLRIHEMRKERESNPQGVLTHARLFSRQLPSPVGLSSRSHSPPHWQQYNCLPQNCGGRIRTCNRLLNRELPYRWATPH